MTIIEISAPILGLIPLNRSLEHFPDPLFTSTILYYEVYVAFAIGVPLNLLVMYVSFIDKTIQNNYKYLLGNLALCDILFLSGLLASNLVHVYVTANDINYTPFSCTLYRIWMITFGVCFLNAIPLISIHRYFVIVRGNYDIFTNRNIIFMSLLVYWPLLYPILAFAHPMYLVGDILCGFNFWFPFIREIILIPVGILASFALFCVIRIYYFLKQHMKMVSTVIDRSKMKDEQSLLLSITIAGILPIFSCTPNILMTILGALLPNHWNNGLTDSWNLGGIVFEHPMLTITMTLYQFNPVFDALLTIFCVRQYRRVIVGWFRKTKVNVSSI
jgi:hypothetical protein